MSRDAELVALVTKRLRLAGVDASVTPYDGGVSPLGHLSLDRRSLEARGVRWRAPAGQVMGILAAVRSLRRNRGDRGF